MKNKSAQPDSALPIKDRRAFFAYLPPAILAEIKRRAKQRGAKQWEVICDAICDGLPSAKTSKK